MSTTNTDFLPNAAGLNLGSPDQPWDGFFSVLEADNLILNGVSTTTGNATSIQGVPVDPATPLTTQALIFNGIKWAPAFQDSNATTLQGFPVSSQAPALTQALIWDGVQWIPTNQSGGGGGGLIPGYVTVPFSVTPTFTPNPSPSACTFSMTLGSNVVSSTFVSTSILPGTPFNFILIQDSVGGYTMSWPVECLGTQFIGTTPLQTTVQNFVWTGVNLVATGFPAVF